MFSVHSSRSINADQKTPDKKSLFVENNISLNDITISLSRKGRTKNVDYYRIENHKPKLSGRSSPGKEVVSEMRIAFDATIGDIAHLKAGKKDLCTLKIQPPNGKRNNDPNGTTARVIIKAKSKSETSYEFNYKLDVYNKGSLRYTRYEPSKTFIGEYDNGSVRFTNLSIASTGLTAKSYSRQYQNRANTTTKLVKAENPPQRAPQHAQALTTKNRSVTTLGSDNNPDGDDVFFDTYRSTEHIPLFAPGWNTKSVLEALFSAGSTNGTNMMTTDFETANQITHEVAAIANATFKSATESEEKEFYYTPIEPSSDEATAVRSNASANRSATYVADTIELAGHYFHAVWTMAGNAYEGTIDRAATFWHELPEIAEAFAAAMGNGPELYE